MSNSNENKYTIRRIQKTDYDNGLIELLSQLTSISKDKIPRDKFNDYVETLSSNNNHITIVVETSTSTHDIVGTATLLIEPKLIHNISKVGHIEDVVVDKIYRSEGIGKMMLEYLKRKADVLECYKVILDCDVKNVPFYEKCGFENKGVEMALYY